MTDTVLRTRDLNSGTVNPDAQGAPLVCASIGFLTYATSSNPTAEAMSSTVDATAGHVYTEASIGMVTAPTLSSGIITIPRDGTYRVKLILTNVTAASNSGVFNFAIQKNSAALTNVKNIAWTNAAAVLPGVHGITEGTISLVKGDTIRAVFTGSVGGIVTVGTGSLSVQMLADATVPTQV